MKKQYPVLILLAVAAVAVFGIFTTACSDTDRLATPSDVRIEEDYLQWNKVDGADAYLVTINGENHVTHDNKFDLLDVTTEYMTYKMSVLAMADDPKNDSLPSGMLIFRPQLVDGLFKYTSVTVNKKSGVMISINTDITDEDFPEKLIIPAFTPDGKSSVIAVGRLSNKKTKSIWMPNSVERIDSYAFSGCEALERVKLSQNLLSVSNYAFRNCVKLKTVDLPGKLNAISATAFENCSSLKEITLPAALKMIDSLGYGFFRGCESLEKIDIQQDDPEKPGAYVSKDGCVIANETNLIKAVGNFTIPDAIELVYAYAFDSNKNIKELTLPDSVKRVASGAFNNCTNLEQINLGKAEQLSSQNYPIFADCTSLKSLTLPASLTSITGNLFKSCDSLESVQAEPGCKYRAVNNFILDGNTLVCSAKAKDFPSEVKKIGGDAFSYSDIEEAVISDGIELEQFAFEHCYSLKKVTLPKSMRIIPVGAFYYCYNLETVEFPQNLSQISASAFSNCFKLSVTLPKNLNVLNGAFSGCTVYSEDSIKNKPFGIVGSGSLFAQTTLAKDNNVPYVYSYKYIPDGKEKTFYAYDDYFTTPYRNSNIHAVPYREGYEFMGWKISEDGEIVYKPYTVTPAYGRMTEYKACLTEKEKESLKSDTTLYAEWKKI